MASEEEREQVNIALFMETFPTLSETYLLWHMTELVRSGQRVELYPVRRGPTQKMHDEVTRMSRALLNRQRMHRHALLAPSRLSTKQ